MELWEKVERTNPKYTKQLTHGAKLTAIGAHYQIRCATEHVGAAGVGWGWTVSDPVYPPNGTAVVKCTLWHGNKDQTVEQFGQVTLAKDDDALKKAGTDGLTKCLSYLGFNADVFMNKFSDSKYVDELRKEFAKVNTEGESKITEARIDELYQSHITTRQDFKEKAKFSEWWNKQDTKKERAELKKLSAEKYEALSKAATIKNESLAVIPSPSGLE